MIKELAIVLAAGVRLRAPHPAGILTSLRYFCVGGSGRVRTHGIHNCGAR